MLDFVEGRYDVLCATAIIESGLDIPRANTILIDRADMFGSRSSTSSAGRVGRARERAYCYLVVPPQNEMTDEARSRIEAMERHTELGSGFQIASLDLELRGAAICSAPTRAAPWRASASSCSARCSTARPCTSCAASPWCDDVDPELSFDAEALLPEEYVATSACACRSTSASRAPRAMARSTTSPPRWRTASVRRRRPAKRSST
jgi:transcription-repair coupling factor (superfamily II helicase)